MLIWASCSPQHTALLSYKDQKGEGCGDASSSFKTLRLFLRLPPITLPCSLRCRPRTSGLLIIWRETSLLRYLRMGRPMAGHLCSVWKTKGSRQPFPFKEAFSSKDEAKNSVLIRDPKDAADNSLLIRERAPSSSSPRLQNTLKTPALDTILVWLPPNPISL